jgi:hypothetical protein
MHKRLCKKCNGPIMEATRLHLNNVQLRHRKQLRALSRMINSLELVGAHTYSRDMKRAYNQKLDKAKRDYNQCVRDIKDCAQSAERKMLRLAQSFESR